MSEPPKSSRSRKKDVQLVVSCQTPKASVVEGRSTSVYEIDIQSGIDFYKNGVKEWYIEKVPEGVDAKVASKDLGVPNHEDAKDDVDHPSTEAYYPKVMETLSNEQRPSRSQNRGFTVQRDLVTDSSTEKDGKTFAGKASKKRQSNPTDAQRKFRKEFKNYIIENFIGDKSSEMKTMVQNYQGVLDNNEVHLHHHEHHHHHHHYYPKGVDSHSPPLIKENYSGSQEIFFATVMTNSNGTTVGKKVFEAETSHLCHGSKESNLAEETIEESKAIPEVGNECPPVGDVSKGGRDRVPAEVLPENQDKRPSENDVSMTMVNKTVSKNVQSSATSLGSKGNEPCGVVFHKNSETSAVLENFEVRGGEHYKNGKSYASLMENFKNFGHFMSPIVITDQKSVPKILYIRCDCSPWNEVDEGETYSQNDSSEETDDGERMIHEGMEKKQAEPVTGPNSNYASDELQKTEEDSSDELEFEMWTSKLRTELQEIKRELKRIEEKQLLDQEANLPIRKGEKARLGPERPITVYSSKTYIMRPSEDALLTFEEGRLQGR